MTDQNPEPITLKEGDITYRQFKTEDDISVLIKLVEPELSEPYSIFLYRHFINDFPELTIIAVHDNQMIGCIVGKIEEGQEYGEQKGYIAMLVVDKKYRKNGIGNQLVNLFIDKCEELKIYTIELETECVNKGALRLYEGKQKIFPNNYFIFR